MFCFRSNIHTPSRFPRTSTLDMHQQCSVVQSLEAATLKGKPWRARKEFDVLVWNIPSSGSRRLTLYFQQTHVSLTVSPKKGDNVPPFVVSTVSYFFLFVLQNGILNEPVWTEKLHDQFRGKLTPLRAEPSQTPHVCHVTTLATFSLGV